MSDYYILNDDHTTRPCDMMEWAMWAAKDKGKSIVKQDAIGEARVSTVFLGLNHAYLGQGAPLIFETMIFGGPEDGYQDRYSTWEQALKGHQKAIEALNKPKPVPEICRKYKDGYGLCDNECYFKNGGLKTCDSITNPEYE